MILIVRRVLMYPHGKPAYRFPVRRVLVNGKWWTWDNHGFFDPSDVEIPQHHYESVWVLRDKAKKYLLKLPPP